MVNNRVIRNKLDRLERQLKNKLVKFYNSKIKGSIIPVGILRQKYNQQLQDLIRSTAQTSYLVGTGEVGNKVLAKDQEFQLFISTTDINNIQGLTDRISNDFWNTAQRLQDREQAVTAEGLPKKLFDHIAALTGIATAVAFSAFNNAVKSKSTQITQTPLQAQLTRQPPTTGDLEVSADFTIERIGRVRFTTQHDARVDSEICAPLDGMEWFVDDPSIVTPPDDTHKNCRCTLEPVIE